MHDRGAPGREVQAAIDREVELVTSAIDLVASGGASTTIVAGLRLTESVIEIVRPLAVERRVVVEPLWGPDETTNDIRVRRETSS
jgi:hypothetical protein